jgi:hypothetical protein
VTGRPEVWSALRQVIDCLREDDLADAQGILDALAITLPTGRLEQGAYDEAGNLYKIPEAVISDPTDVVEGERDVDSQTVTGTSDFDVIAAKLEAAEGDNLTLRREESSAEKTTEAKGKAAIEKDAMKVKCRLSDRGGPDVVVLLGRTQRVGTLAQRIRDETEVCGRDGGTRISSNFKQVPTNAKIKIAYLGKILDDKLSLDEQGWKEGHVVNALVVGRLNG